LIEILSAVNSKSSEKFQLYFFGEKNIMTYKIIVTEKINNKKYDKPIGNGNENPISGSTRIIDAKMTKKIVKASLTILRMVFPEYELKTKDNSYSNSSSKERLSGSIR